ncbi:MAG: RNA 2',3'-cyclic phosphodiesterase [Candidatus Omnitrophica bacterium]|nr:RNA 2',3'-cyclic phosphodiesterase [Candidatus Omnitrophota bacterium]MBU4479191.1 RNA 2',3'-cyclic phosphodiesterase [Candidatus Omnitrophota bacterium]MCG2704195.1 RNA 2',3'-cyclic phosphodiesterase [Candidatus Omnitrophota bacterium]
MENAIRTFIAIEANGIMRQELCNIQTLFKKQFSGNISWVKPENIHLTLRFLGHIQETQLEQIKKVITAIAKDTKKFTMDLGVFGVFPDTLNPHVLWVGINFGFDQLNSINAQIEEKLETINFGVGEKFFHPHFTLARIKKVDNKKTLEILLKTSRPKESFSNVDKISMFKSEITPQGAVYTKIFEEELAS